MATQQELDAVFAYIDEHRDDYIGLLQSFVRQPSIAATGEGIEDMKNLVVKTFEDLGVDTLEVYPTDGNPVVYAYVNGDSERTFGSYDHYDVMPVEPIDEWVDPPYSATIRDGQIWGRGVADNKNGIAAKVAAADAWKKAVGSVPCNIKYFVEGEEEIGSPHLEQFAREHQDLLTCDGYNWESGWKEPGEPAQVIIGSKGLLYVELHAKTADIDKHSAYACLIPNAAWRLVFALATLKDPETDRILIDGFYDDVTPLTDVDMKALEEDSFTIANFKKLFNVDHLLPGYDTDEMAAKKKYYFEPTCNICGIEAGYTAEGSKTLLPTSAFCKIDFRLAMGQDPQKILKLLREHLDRHGFEDIEVIETGAEPGYRCSEDDPFVQAVIEAARETFHEEPVVHPAAAGTSPQPIFCDEQGLSSAMFGCISDTANIHIPNEHLAVESFIDEIKFMAATMRTVSEM